MQDDRVAREMFVARRIAHDIHEMTYFKHVTRANEQDIRRVMEKVGRNRTKVERELRRLTAANIRDSAA